MQNNSRTYNAVINSLYGIAASLITVILNFCVRLVLVKSLGEEINGLNSLFQSVVSVMTLMELGVSSAMIIHLYEPVKNNDRSTIAGIMSFYRKIYRGVAICFGVVGLLVDALLIDKLVTSSIPVQTVRFYFLIFVSSFVLNYLTCYKRSLLFAQQKNRISTGVTAVCEVVYRSIQIVTLLYCKDYYIFLGLLILEKLSSNLICNYYVDKHFPFLRNNDSIITYEKKQAIFQTIKPLMVNQTATVVQNSAASILISMLLGNVSIVGYYGVYQMVMAVIQLIFSQLGTSFTTSFGNLAVENNRSAMKVVYKHTSFVFFFAASVCGSLFIACIDDFVSLFFGPNFVLNPVSVAFLTLSMLVSLLCLPVISIQNSMGLHRFDAKAMVLQAILALIGGYILGMVCGMPGILIGILLPMVVLTVFRKGIVITKVAFNMGAKEFSILFIRDFVLIIIVIAIVAVICKSFCFDVSFWGISIKFVASLILSTILFSLLCYQREEYKWFLKTAKVGLNSMLNKNKKQS